MLDDIKQLFDKLRTAKFEIREFEVSAPYHKVPNEVDEIPIPHDLTDVYENQIGRLDAKFFRELSDVEQETFGESLGAVDLYGGPLLAGADELADLKQQAMDWANETWIVDEEEDFALWASTIPFAQLRNGDFIGFNKIGQIVYLNHDDESSVIANTFDEFWTTWQQIYFVGPEWWMLEPFMNEDKRLDPTSPNIPTFRAAFERLLKGQ